jgi:hypothetical protein
MSFFPNDSTAKIWGTVKNNMQDVLNTIPQQYSSVTTQVQQSLDTYNATVQQLNALQSAAPVISDTSNGVAAFNALTTEAADLKNYEQYLFDNNVHQQYIIGVNSSNNPSYFSQWYLAQLKTQYDKAVSDLQSKFAEMIMMLTREMQIKKEIQQYQGFVHDVQQQWFQLLSQQIIEQAAVIEKIQAINYTQRRKSVFNVDNIQMLQKISHWITVIFLVAVLFLLIFLVKNNQDLILLKAKSVASFQR